MNTENDILTAEAAAEANQMQILSVAAFAARFQALGYKLDRTLDCRSVARFMTGEHAGKSYLCVTTGVSEADTGLSAFHFAARRDSKFKQMQKLRQEVCAISRGALLEA